MTKLEEKLIDLGYVEYIEFGESVYHNNLNRIILNNDKTKILKSFTKGISIIYDYDLDIMKDDFNQLKKDLEVLRDDSRNI